MKHEIEETDLKHLAAELSIAERLKVLLPHWNHHNDEHITQLQAWRDEMIEEELNELAETINSAVFHMKCSGEYLSQVFSGLNHERDKNEQI